jgi:putative sterol carrier protein
MAEFFSQAWADEAKDAINSFPDDAYRETKLFMYWDWIDAARKGFNGKFALCIRDLPNNGSSGPRYVAFDIKDGQCTGAEIVDGPPEDAKYVLAGNYDVWKDIASGYDAGKAVMYRRLRLEQGDVFRFFNRIYFFTESLVALQKVPATMPA